MGRGSRLLALLLCGLLAAGVPAGAQGQPGLQIVVVQGEGAVNDIDLGVGRELIVEFRDENDKPVPGAKVTFSLPGNGPGGTFFGASRKITVTTDEQGRATSTGFRPNLQEGPFQIQVSAALGDRTATATIHQSNARPSGGASATSPKKRFGVGKIVAIVAGVGIIAALLATRNGNGARPVPTQGSSITPGNR